MQTFDNYFPENNVKNFIQKINKKREKSRPKSL